MEKAEVPTEEWPQKMSTLLSGKALDAYYSNVTEEEKKDFKLLREALLRALGCSLEQCHADFWNYRKRYQETWQETSRQVGYMIKRMAYGLILSSLHLSKFLSMCPAECARHIKLKNPKTPLEAANLAEDYLREQEKERQRLAFKKDHQYQKAQGKKFEQQDGKKFEQQEGKKGNVGEPPKYNKYGSGGSPSNRYRNDRGYRSPTCFGCGHKVADCKEKKDTQV